MIHEPLFMALSALGGFLGGVAGSILCEAYKRPSPKVSEFQDQTDTGIGDVMPDVEVYQAEDATDDVEYTVAGVPRTMPWHLRRRDLEAKHRAKRRQRDEFRENS